MIHPAQYLTKHNGFEDFHFLFRIHDMFHHAMASADVLIRIDYGSLTIREIKCSTSIGHFISKMFKFQEYLKK